MQSIKSVNTLFVNFTSESRFDTIEPHCQHQMYVEFDVALIAAIYMNLISTYSQPLPKENGL